MLTRRAVFVLGMGAGALIRPLMAVGAWLLWQHQSRPHTR